MWTNWGLKSTGAASGRPPEGQSLTLCLKSEILLRKITERHDNDRGQDLGESGINMELLYKELDEDIIQQQTNDHQHKISEQLYPSMQGAFRKHNITHQKEPHRETKTPGDNNGSDMGLDHQKTKIDIVLVQDKIVPDRIHHNIDQGIASPTGRISKGLQRHDPAKRRIKEIYKGDYALFD
jgi:hypothetical protein